jgi:phytoene dehydrogenase-like protein
MNRYDVIVIGAGHNGLTTAALLAKKGRKVLVVEKRAVAGGLAASEEFHPGFRTPGILHDTTALRRSVIQELDLARHGLKLRKDDVPVFAPQKSGRGLLLWRDPQKAEEELAPFSAGDVKAYRGYRAFIGRMAPFLRRVFDDFPPDIATMSFPGLWDLMKKAVSLRMLGKSDMMEILRVGPMCVADWLNEWFETDLLKACLAGPAVFSTYTGPWSPGSNANLLLAEALAEAPVAGGPQALAKALEAAARAAGVEIRTNTEVKELIVDGLTVKGVVLTDGTRLEAAKVAAACDPKQVFLKLVPPAKLPRHVETDIANVRARGTTAKVHLAVSRYPEWVNRPSLKVEYVRTGEHVDELEKAFDAVKYRGFSKAPVLDIYVPTLEAPELAPSGQHVVSILVSFAPHQLEGGWNDAQRAALYETTLATLEAYAPGIRSSIVGHEVLTPADLEARYNLTGGHLHHGEHAADQLLVRPTPACSRYETPFAGLYLCGSGSHPGGGITCAPGAFAARVI